MHQHIYIFGSTFNANISVDNSFAHRPLQVLYIVARGVVVSTLATHASGQGSTPVSGGKKRD